MPAEKGCCAAEAELYVYHCLTVIGTGCWDHQESWLRLLEVTGVELAWLIKGACECSLQLEHVFLHNLSCSCETDGFVIKIVFAELT